MPNVENMKKILESNDFSKEQIKQLFIGTTYQDEYEKAKIYLKVTDFKLTDWEIFLVEKNEKIFNLYNSKVLYENLTLNFNKDNKKELINNKKFKL